jgi:Ser/Thr protein kinase RdoA (MazF antagonist)
VGDVEISRAGPADVAVAAGVYGLGTVLGPPTPAARGQQGIVWRVETDRGRFAVKELIEPLTEAEVAVDVALQSTMVARGVYTPQPLLTPAGRALTTVGPLLFRAYTWVDIDDERLDLDPAAVGTLLATLHRDPLPAGPPVDPWYTDPVPDGEWTVVAQRLTAAGAPFAAEFAASVPHFRAMQALFRPPGPTQLCHRDLWAGNIRFSPDGPDGLCVIDWDNCGPAEAVQELAMPLFDFCQRDPGRARALYRAYLDAGGPARFTGRGDFTMVLAQFGHFAITAGEWWLETTNDDHDDDRDRAEAWFREGWERPLDVAGVDELLDAVRHA